ncbi:MAG: Zn-ribbon domain-containing OB-fold protein [Actinomycetota bacterium]
MTQHVTPDGLLLPLQDDDGRPFWEGAAAGELRMQACTGCARLRFPPRPMCPWCRSLDQEWRTMSGRGTVWSFVVPHPPLLPAYAELAPYNVVVVALDEEPTIRLVGNLVATDDGQINEVDPATIEIGRPVRVVFQRIAEGVALPRWVPV